MTRLRAIVSELPTPTWQRFFQAVAIAYVLFIFWTVFTLAGFDSPYGDFAIYVFIAAGIAGVIASVFTADRARRGW